MITPGETLVPEPVEAAQAAFDARWQRAAYVSELRAMQPHLPQLPDTAAQEVYEQVADAERRLAAPHLLLADYGEGTATTPDQVVVLPAGPVILGADHATDPVRKATGLRGGADHGTAGLAAVLAAEGLGHAIIPIGKQTGNATVNPDYPYKDVLKQQLAVPRAGLLSIHGMMSGLVFRTTDETEIHALVGLGAYEPRPETLAVADALIARARDELGLRVAISDYGDEPHGNRHLIYAKDPAWQPGDTIRDKVNLLRSDDHGEPKRSRLAAKGLQSTASFVMRETAGRPMPVFQMEVARSLRLTTQDEFTRDPKELAMGVYLGYLLTQLAAQLMAESPQV